MNHYKKDGWWKSIYALMLACAFPLNCAGWTGMMLVYLFGNNSCLHLKTADAQFDSLNKANEYAEIVKRQGNLSTRKSGHSS